MSKKKSTPSKWQDLLPSSYGWLKTLKLSQAAKAAAGAHHLVVAKSLKDSKTKGWEFVSKDLSKAFADKIKATAVKLDIKSGSPARTFLVNDEIVHLVFLTSLDVSAKQKGAQVGLDVAKCIADKEIAKLAIYGGPDCDSLDVFAGLAQGVYRLNGFRSKNPEIKLPKAIELLATKSDNEGLKQAVTLARCLTLVRFIEDSPPNWLNPVQFAKIAKDMSVELKMSCKIISGEAIKEAGMGTFYSVSQGSAVPAQLICLEIKGKNPAKTVALIGKGLTFDAGGLSVKPALGMHEMKYDMCGGGAVLGAACFLAQHQPAVNVVCLIGSVENLIGEKATRPGDIVKSLSGKTVEILNTDAEGRLVLCDLLAYSRTKWKPNLIVDIATLTGAVSVALGAHGCAVLANKQAVADRILAASKSVGEPIWQLPIWPEMPKELKSDIADLRNITSPNTKAGTISAAAYLQEFVGDSDWAHLDIAATAWSCRATGYPTNGASGFGVRTLIQTVQSFWRP